MGAGLSRDAKRERVAEDGEGDADEGDPRGREGFGSTRVFTRSPTFGLGRLGPPTTLTPPSSAAAN